MNIIEMNIEDITPYKNNPRNNDAAVDKVAKSIKDFGFTNPIIVDSDNVVIAGHTRLLAAKRLGMKTVPVIVKTDLSPEQAKAFRLVDNKSAEFSSWDWEKLETELAELQSMDFDLSGFDFDMPTTSNGYDDFFEENSPSENDNEAPAESAEQKEIVCPHCGKSFTI